jgi:excisionase family DNA binding protein
MAKRRSGQTVHRLALSPQEAAQALGLGVWTVQKLLRQGKLPYKKAGRRVLIPVSALEVFLNGEEVKDAASR